MRLLQLLLALLFVAAGVVFGALNPQTTMLDFYYLHQSVGVGVALLVALLIGALLGGMAISVGVVWPLRRKLRQAHKRQAQPLAATYRLSEDDPATAALVQPRV